MKLRKKRRARRKRRFASTVLKESEPAGNNTERNWPLPFVLRSVKNYFEKEIPK
jgi:hypothetical protein